MSCPWRRKADPECIPPRLQSSVGLGSGSSRRAKGGPTDRRPSRRPRADADNLPDLRDHLALAATCRTIRSFYHDVVWQVRPSRRPSPSFYLADRLTHDRLLSHALQVLFYASFPDLCVPSWAVEVTYAPSQQLWLAKKSPDELRSYLAVAVLLNTGLPAGPYERGWNASPSRLPPCTPCASRLTRLI